MTKYNKYNQYKTVDIKKGIVITLNKCPIDVQLT